ncbi:hypothetical protein KEF85_16625 [Methylomonas paludis]|uniref:Uncharacterized protein n=1 Tax=Methylomonas paludis TaxID=1173101 RepID=A0A975MN43_9GAMM|nr:hypothetical protein [Methylomonas paludis]QWF70906.1 hypothetical protein KEF85_16625 [Methylomonas paludis]
MTNITLTAAFEDVSTLQAHGSRLMRITAFNTSYAIRQNMIGQLLAIQSAGHFPDNYRPSHQLSCKSWYYLK